MKFLIILSILFSKLLAFQKNKFMKMKKTAHKMHLKNRQATTATETIGSITKTIQAGPITNTTSTTI